MWCSWASTNLMGRGIGDVGRCGMVRYGMSDELGASYGWCRDIAVLYTRVFELGPLLLSWVKSASFIFAIMDGDVLSFDVLCLWMANVLWLWMMVMVSFVLGGVVDDMRRE